MANDLQESAKSFNPKCAILCNWNKVSLVLKVVKM